jgi:glycosyltransferase A (GT-A) superfamily protein (DUF2064 family)
MSGFVVPEIEQALIVFARYPEMTEKSQSNEVGQSRETAAQTTSTDSGNRLFALLDVISKMDEVSPYIFYTPAELMDEIEDWLSPYAERFALAAQMGDDPAEQIRNAFRRIFSRNSIRKAIMVDACNGTLDEATITQGFRLLDTADVVAGPNASGNGIYLLGMRQPYSWVFESLGGPLETCDFKRIESASQASGVQYKQLAISGSGA